MMEDPRDDGGSRRRGRRVQKKSAAASEDSTKEKVGLEAHDNNKKPRLEEE